MQNGTLDYRVKTVLTPRPSSGNSASSVTSTVFDSLLALIQETEDEQAYELPAIDRRYDTGLPMGIRPAGRNPPQAKSDR
jgi:hypothetical protein